jgi:Uma2 family endonuclease
VLLRGVAWDVYEAMVESESHGPGTRLSYLEGDLEVMTPSPRHERRKSLVGRLVEAYADELGLVLNAYGSTTFKDKAKGRGAEPDECYVLRDIADPDVLVAPDFVIEIVETSWQVDKLAIYLGLGVPEVWIWRTSVPEVYALESGRYVARTRSRLLPLLDLEQLASFSERPDQARAVREYRARVREATKA